MSKHKSSSGDGSRETSKYLTGIGDGERLKAIIIREHPSDPASHVRIIQNGICTYNSRLR